MIAEVPVPAELAGDLHRVEAFSLSLGSKLRLRRIVAIPTAKLGTTGLTRYDSQSTVASMDDSVDMSRKLTPGVPTFVPTSGVLDNTQEV